MAVISSTRAEHSSTLPSPTTNSGDTTSIAHHPAGSAETVLYQDAFVYVSTQRLVVGITSLDIRMLNTTHVRRLAIRIWPVNVLLLCSVAAGGWFFSTWSLIAALVCAVLLLCIVGLIRAIRPNYILQVVTRQGPMDVLMSQDKTFIGRVYDAVNEALKQRTAA